MAQFMSRRACRGGRSQAFVQEIGRGRSPENRHMGSQAEATTIVITAWIG